MAKVGEGVRGVLDELKEYVHGLVPQKGMFSTLDELVQSAPFEKAPADQWANFLKPGRMLKRGDLQFPLKQEELDWALPEMKDWAAGANPTILEKQKVLDYMRKNRAEFGLTFHSEGQPGESPANNIKRIEAVNPVPGEDQQDFDRFRVGQPTYGPNSEAGYERLWHSSGEGNDFQESATRLPHRVSYMNHFEPDTISHSRASIHEVPNSLDNARLVEEIQSDLHQDATDKWRPHTWRNLLSTEDAKLVSQLEDEKFQIGHERESNHWGDSPPEIRDRQENEFISRQVAIDLQLRNMREGIDSKLPRKGYRTKDRPFLPGEALTTEKLAPSGSDYIFVRMDDDGNVVARDPEHLTEHTLPRNTVAPFTMRNAPPDAPFKDPSEYARLELKKQLLQAAHSGEGWLALTRGADQVDRYSLTGKKAENMTNIYDKIYHGELKKLANQYGAKVEDLALPVGGNAKDIRPEFMTRNGLEGAEEAHDYLNGDFLEGGIDNIDHSMLDTMRDDMKSAYMHMSDMYATPRDAATRLREMHDRMRSLMERVTYDSGTASGRMPEVTWTDQTRQEMREINRDFANDIKEWIRYNGDEFGQAGKADKTFPAIRITPEVRARIKKHGASLWAKGGAVRKKKIKRAEGGFVDRDYEAMTHHASQAAFNPTEELFGRSGQLGDRAAEAYAEQLQGLDEHGQVKSALYHDWDAPREEWTWNDEAGMPLPPLKATEPQLSRGFRTLPEQFLGDRNNPSESLRDLREVHGQLMDRSGLDEPQGFAENLATAGGSTAAQVPVPGGFFGKLAGRMPAMLRAAAYLPAKYMDYLGPTIHPSLGSYGSLPLVGAGIDTASKAYTGAGGHEQPPTLDDDQLHAIDLHLARMRKMASSD